MPRRNLIRTSTIPYHVTSRSNNREWFDLPGDEVWQIAWEVFRYAYSRFPVDLHSFVLMSNHYHMLLTTPNADIDLFMQAFNKRFSDLLRERTRYINRMFGGPYHWSLVEDQYYLANVYRYIYQNPKRAGIVEKCEDYPYSTLSYKVKKRLMEFGAVSSILIFAPRSIETQSFDRLCADLFSIRKRMAYLKYT